MAIHWIVFLAALLPFWLLQNVLHELAHGLALKLGWGWKFSIWPFPSKRLGRFTFANVVYEPTCVSKVPTSKGWAFISAMPKIMNLFFFFASIIVGLMISRSHKVVAFLCEVFGICNMVDFSFGMASIFRREPNQSDMWRFQSNLNLDLYNFRWFSAWLIFAVCSIMGMSTYFLVTQ